MKVRDLYGLAVRLAGLVFFLYAIFDLVHLIAPMAGIAMPSQYPPSVLAAVCGVWLLLGLVLTFGANAITRIVYGPDSAD
jgi:hypothetical protein